MAGAHKPWTELFHHCFGDRHRTLHKVTCQDQTLAPGELGSDAPCLRTPPCVSLAWGPILIAHGLHSAACQGDLPGLLLMNSHVCMGHCPSAAALEAQPPLTSYSPDTAQTEKDTACPFTWILIIVIGQGETVLKRGNLDKMFGRNSLPLV